MRPRHVNYEIPIASLIVIFSYVSKDPNGGRDGWLGLVLFAEGADGNGRG